MDTSDGIGSGLATWTETEVEPTRGRPPAAAARGRGKGDAAAGDVLHSYMRSIRNIPVLSREQHYELAAEIQRESDAFFAAMLAIPETAEAVLARWRERKRTGHVSAALSRFYRDPARPRLSEEMDAALGSVEELVRKRKAARDVATRRRLEAEVTEGLGRAELALEVLIDVHRELEAGPGRVRRGLLREATRALAGLTDAKQRFVRHNLKLVVRYARAYQRAEVPLLDLIQEGNVGLMRAVDKFDHTLGNTFSTYAVWWIQQAMVRAIQKYSRTVRVPSHIYDLQLRHRRVEHELRAAGGGEPGREDVAEALGLDPEAFDQLESSMRPIASTARPVAGADDLTLEDALADEDASDPAEGIDRMELGEALSRSLRHLPRREQHILVWRFGLGGEPTHTLDEVGQKLGLSRERVRQIEHRALSRLRDREEVRALVASLA